MAMNLLVVALTFLVMEFVANFTHKYLMHGWMWYWHEDHHKGSPGIFEKNDIFFVIFATPSIFLINFGFWFHQDLLLDIGLGIMFYGMAYFLVHEVLIHRRMKWLDALSSFYSDALKKAHRDHHRKLTKEGCENFGMLWVPLKYYKS